METKLANNYYIHQTYNNDRMKGLIIFNFVVFGGLKRDGFSTQITH